MDLIHHFCELHNLEKQFTMNHNHSQGLHKLPSYTCMFVVYPATECTCKNAYASHSNKKGAFAFLDENAKDAVQQRSAVL